MFLRARRIYQGRWEKVGIWKRRSYYLFILTHRKQLDITIITLLVGPFKMFKWIFDFYIHKTKRRLFTAPTIYRIKIPLPINAKLSKNTMH